MTSLVAQLVKNLLAMQEIWVRFLGWEDSLEKGMATHSSIHVIVQPSPSSISQIVHFSTLKLCPG